VLRVDRDRGSELLRKCQHSSCRHFRNPSPKNLGAHPLLAQPVTPNAARAAGVTLTSFGKRASRRHRLAPGYRNAPHRHDRRVNPRAAVFCWRGWCKRSVASPHCKHGRGVGCPASLRSGNVRQFLQLTDAAAAELPTIAPAAVAKHPIHPTLRPPNSPTTRRCCRRRTTSQGYTHSSPRSCRTARAVFESRGASGWSVRHERGDGVPRRVLP
jgi:hypothetical protein